MDIKENYPLKNLTSFKIGGPARYFIEITEKKELPEVFKFANEKKLAVLRLGGGSNMLVSDAGFDGVVVRVSNKGINVEANEDEAKLTAAAGEVWDEVVEQAVAAGWWGIENLSLIPGLAGSAPVQNIGAYGQELSSTLDSVEVYDQDTNEIKTMNQDECGFGYRQSVFNSHEKGRYIILEIMLRLKRNSEPNISYPDLIKYFVEKGVVKPSLREMRQAVVEIRTRKHYDPTKVGNAGSFFRNLFLTDFEYQQLEEKIKQNFSPAELSRLLELKNKFRSDQGIKIPAAFVIDLCGLKSASVCGAQISDKQPIVIINKTGAAKASDVMSLFKLVRQSVYARTGLALFNEPELVGFNEAELADYLKL